MKPNILNTLLIADFMGYDVITYKGKLTYNGNKYGKTIGELKNLWGGLDLEFTGRFVDDVEYPFETDFNYLIPVIRHIEEQGFVVSIAGIKYQVYRVMDESNPVVSLVCGDLSKKTELVFNLIINFLKWQTEAANKTTP